MAFNHLNTFFKRCKLCTTFNSKIMESIPRTCVVRRLVDAVDKDECGSINQQIERSYAVIDLKYSKKIQKILKSKYLDEELGPFENVIFHNKRCEKILEIQGNKDKQTACIDLDCVGSN